MIKPLLRTALLITGIFTFGVTWAQGNFRMCADRPDYYKERFVSCYTDKGFCEWSNENCWDFCSGWMGCVWAVGRTLDLPGDPNNGRELVGHR